MRKHHLIWFICVLGACAEDRRQQQRTVHDDSCPYALDGACDEPTYCHPGTDSTDCGRDVTGPNPNCTPDCSNLGCGLDPVCGMPCGTCMAGQGCEAGVCINNGCVPDCSGRTCGIDPTCSVSCGECGEGSTCDAAGVCQGETPLPKLCGLSIVVQTNQSFDIQTVMFSGSITVDQTAFFQDNGSAAGCVYLKQGELESRLTCLNSSDLGRFNASVIPGTYDVIYQDTACEGNAPCGKPVLLEQGLVIAGPTSKSYNISTVELRGGISVNGAAFFQENSNAAGCIYLRDPATREHESRLTCLSGGDNGAYVARVLPGLYEVVYRAFDCEQTAPCSERLIDPALSIAADTLKSYDLRTVSLSGAIAVNGVAFFQENSSAAGCVYIRENGSEHRSLLTCLNSFDSGEFDVQVFPGDYTIEYEAPVCEGTAPCGAPRILETTNISAAAVKTYQLQSAHVTGAVSVDQTAFFQDNSSAAGCLYLVDPTSSLESLLTCLNGFDRGVIDAAVFPGTYRVVYRASSCEGTAPCGERVIENNWAIAADTQRNFDLTTVGLSGSITAAGRAFFQDNNSAAGCVFIEEIGSNQPSNLTCLNSSDRGMFQARVFPGTYRLRYEATICEGTAPCNDFELASGLALTTDTVQQLDIPAVPFDGSLLHNSAQFFQGNYSAGCVSMIDVSSRESSTLACMNESKPFSVWVVPGEYALEYRATTCGEGWPCATQMLTPCP